MIRLTDTDDRLLELQSETLTPVALVTLGLTPAAYLTDAGIDVVAPDAGGVSRTWKSGSISALTPPDSERNSRRHTMTVQFAEDDPSLSNSWYNRLKSVWTGIPIRVLVRFYKDDNMLTEALDLYKGFGSSFAIEGGIEGEYISQVTFTGELVNVDQESSVLTSSDNQSIRDSDDTSFKYIARAAVFKWGRR